MAKKKEDSKKFRRPVLLTIIASYFLLEGFGAILDFITSVAFYLPTVYHFLTKFRFLYVELPGIQSNDPFTAAVIQTIPLYSDPFIYMKDIFIIVMFLLAGYTIFRMKKLGFYLGLFITICGLIAGTTYGFRHNPIEYLQNIFGRFSASTSSNIEGVILIISFLLCLFTPVYLILNRRLFTK